jgi:hypothetical protein
MLYFDMNPLTPGCCGAHPKASEFGQHENKSEDTIVHERIYLK